MVKLEYFILLLLSIVSISNSNAKNRNDNGNLDKYISINIKLNKDTLVYNDTLFVTVNFVNKADSYVLFYPNAYLSIEPLYDPQKVFIEYSPCLLNEIHSEMYKDVSILNNIQIIKPHDQYSKTYTIIIKNPFFFNGINKRKIAYICHNVKTIREHNILYGRLESPPFTIFVK